jgi:N-acetylmuramoyl-L-alanine amidase
MDTLTYLLDRAAELNADIPPGLRDKRVVTADTLNVRAGPGTGYLITRRLKKGDAVNVIETEGAWVRISSYEWVFADYLR